MSWSAYTKPFSRGVWLGLALTIVSLATVFHAISQWHLRQELRTLTARKHKAALFSAPLKVSRYRLWKKDSLLLVWAAFTQQGTFGGQVELFYLLFLLFVTAVPTLRLFSSFSYDLFCFVLLVLGSPEFFTSLFYYLSTTLLLFSTRLFLVLTQFLISLTCLLSLF